jgi:hypothetical protein
MSGVLYRAYLQQVGLPNDETSARWASEKNFGAFLVTKSKKEGGKPHKSPLKLSNPGWITGTEKGFVSDLPSALEMIESLRKKYCFNYTWDKLTDLRKKAQGIGYSEGDVVDLVLGYIPRAGSTFVVGDLDGILVDGKVPEGSWAESVLAGGGWFGVTPSGTGLRA